MDQRALRLLEFDKVRDRLAACATFSLGQTLARQIEPSDDIRQVAEWQAETSEARRLLEEKAELHLGGVRDVRPLVDSAALGGVLVPLDLVDIRSTLVRAQTLQRSFARLQDAFPHVADVALRINTPQALLDRIAHCIDERGEVLDRASEALSRIRRELRVSHDRLLERLQHIVSNATNAPYLQEHIVTQRQGRYVIPIRAEFKGRIPGLVHDQSGSGATLFIEPFSVVDLNNSWREAQLAEQEEIYQILSDLSRQVAADGASISRAVEALGELDVIFARGRYANAIRGVEPMLVPFPRRTGKRPATDVVVRPPDEDSGMAHPGSVLDLKAARHPLLDPLTVVPIDIYTSDDFFVILITGPNTGGKTVSLKTAGLLVLMAQAGLAIPATGGSRLTVFEDVFADIGDEQSIEQSLSTFSSHMSHIVEIFAKANERSLVLLDELGAGTDPDEGAALAQSLLKELLARRVTALATTHYSELKLFAHNTPFVANACVEFDVETLSPTYRLSIGLPGRSNAFAIARRLGVAERIVAGAEALISSESKTADAMLAEIKRARETARALEDAARTNAARAEALQADLAHRLSGVEQARREVLEQTRAEAAAELEAARLAVKTVQAGLDHHAAGAPASPQTIHQAFLAEAEELLARRAERAQQLPAHMEVLPQVVDGPLLAGDKVWVPSLQASGEVVSVGVRDLEVKIGSFRMRLGQPRVQLQERGGQPAVQASASLPKVPDPGMELDLRGQTVEEMLAELDRYLDAAYRAGLPFVRLIHGKGTGALRQAVRDQLRSHPLVSSYRTGESNEGGDGVTVAKLVQR